VRKVMNVLVREDLITPRSVILDVGCGPGTFTLPFSDHAESVVALDGSAEMCSCLEKRIQQEDRTNIRVVPQLWQDVDLRKEGWEGRFDLVFASLTPAISDSEAVDKLNRASRLHCCLISSVFDSFSKAREDLWRILLNEKGRKQGSRLQLIFNLLFSMGCCPVIQYLDSDWVREETVEQAVERFSRAFWLYSELTPEIQAVIYEYVKERAVDGVFREILRRKLGIVCWSVDHIQG